MISVKVADSVDTFLEAREDIEVERLQREKYWIRKIAPTLNPKETNQIDRQRLNRALLSLLKSKRMHQSDVKKPDELAESLEQRQQLFDIFFRVLGDDVGRFNLKQRGH